MIPVQMRVLQVVSDMAYVLFYRRRDVVVETAEEDDTVVGMTELKSAGVRGTTPLARTSCRTEDFSVVGTI
jgi:hypothetical protein